MAHYHHTVTLNATPFREFTKWCLSGQMRRMDIAVTRRSNLKAYVISALADNNSELARLTRRVPSFFNDLFAGRKSFGEKLARKLEKQLGLPHMSLDEPSDAEAAGPSPLLHLMSPYGDNVPWI
jgi:hypothetical protein